MEEQGRGGSEFLDVNKGEHVNKVALPGFDVLGIFAIRWWWWWWWWWWCDGDGGDGNGGDGDGDGDDDDLLAT